MMCSENSPHKMRASGRLQPETPTRPRVHSSGAELPTTKQRKANSEVRKQQNRIASRNYREKRKRKLQHLQEILEDDGSGEAQIRARSKSPYEDRSYSGSIGYEHSSASSSPHIATVAGSFESPQPDHAEIASQTWSTPVIPSNEQTFMYTHPHSAAYSESAIYNTDIPATTNYPVWNPMPSMVSTEYTTPALAQQRVYSSHPSQWSSSGHKNFISDTANHQVAMPDTAPYVPPWQYCTSDDLPGGIAIDTYGRTYYTYFPS